MRCPLLICAVALGLLALPLAAAAEGSGHPNTTAPDKPDGARVRRSKARPKAPAPMMPVEPIPYAVYAGTGSPVHVAAATPVVAPTVAPEEVPAGGPASSQPAVSAAPPAPPPPADPLPPPVEVLPAPEIAPAPPPSEISLKCETRTTRGVKQIAAGSFYIDLFPSPVFPDSLASFQFRFVDPAYDSLVRQSICLDTICSAQVTAMSYDLVNRVTKRGRALRIALDRSGGAFYAESIVGQMRIGEHGTCTVQALPAAKF